MNIIPAFIHRKIAHRPNLVNIVDNIGWLFFDKVLRMGVGLFVGVWVARYLGPEQFGLLNFALAFTGMFGAIAGLGLQGIVVRDIVRDPSGAKLTLGSAVMLHLFGGLAAFLLIVFTIAQLRPDDGLARTIIAILGSMMFLEAGKVTEYWFESQVQSKYTVWVKNAVFLAFSVIKVFLIWQQAPLMAFVLAMLAEASLVALLLFIFMGRYGPTLTSLSASLARMKALIHDSWPFMLSGVAIMVYLKIDLVMLGEMIDDEAVGIYTAATRISEVWYFIPMVIVASVFPAILEAKERSEALYYARLQKLYDLMVVLSMSVSLPMAFLAARLVELLYGETYAVAGTVLAIHIWASIFVFLGVASSRWFLVENRQALGLQRPVIGAIANVLLNLVLIPIYGVIGAAVATLVSYAIADFIFDIVIRETRKMFFMKVSAINPARLFNIYISRRPSS